jgi:hypothetical protein
MKSATKLIYVFIFIFAAIYVFKHENYCKRIEIINGYCINYTVTKGNDISFYLNPKIAARKGIITVNDINGVVIDSFEVCLDTQKSINEIVIEQKPQLYTQKFAYNTGKLQQGIYLFGNKIPFIVKAKHQNQAIKILFPYLSLHAVNNKGGKSFIYYNSSNNEAAKHLSLKRTLQVDDYTRNLINWLDVNYPHQYDIIVDYEFEKHHLDHNNFLVLYGNSDFIPINIKKSIEKSILNGTNALVISSSLFQSIIRHYPEEQQISYFGESKFDPEKVDSLKTGLATDIIFNDGNHLQFGISSQPSISKLLDNLSNGTFYLRNSLNGKIISPKSEIPLHNVQSLNGLRLNLVAINGEKYYLKNFKQFEKFEILAEAKIQLENNFVLPGNIVFLQKTKLSGKQISIGSNDWLNKENINDSLVSGYTKSIFDFLLLKD